MARRQRAPASVAQRDEIAAQYAGKISKLKTSREEDIELRNSMNVMVRREKERKKERDERARTKWRSHE